MVTKGGKGEEDKSFVVAEPNYYIYKTDKQDPIV